MQTEKGKTMRDLISRQAAIDAIENYFGGLPIQGRYDILKILKELPSVDTVPVVRCKDCKYHDTFNCWMQFYDRDYDGRLCMICNYTEDNGYCFGGERKDDPSHPFADDVMMGE